MTTTPRRRILTLASLVLVTAYATTTAPPSASAAASTRLVITKGGTADRPAVYRGHGDAVDGITVEADHVVVEGYTVDTPKAPGVEITGDDITIRNNTVTRPHGGDGDGLRFFGTDLKILHNTIRGASNSYGHADCMQTFASDTPPSRGVLIEGNRCEDIDNMCLMAEGPNDGEGDGHGHTSGFTVRNNYCETLKASQTLMFEDVQNTTITDNIFAAAPDHAIGLAIHSTDAHISGNKVSPHIRYEVGIDTSSLPGYVGPEPGGAP
ncbi:right-handed parallel beta-helix repeat-containing protein [Streptomyces sp. NPDC001339]|uniref:right-handed parallel beta-helix repeat-containing protein n=1 Tax=Streptomyces sp. NPDC001339 TaxID=3364563 RepID=UPI0036CE4C78